MTSRDTETKEEHLSCRRAERKKERKTASLGRWSIRHLPSPVRCKRVQCAAAGGRCGQSTREGRQKETHGQSHWLTEGGRRTHGEEASGGDRARPAVSLVLTTVSMIRPQLRDEKKGPGSMESISTTALGAALLRRPVGSLCHSLELEKTQQVTQRPAWL